MAFEIKRVSEGPKHHLFGFHDLITTNKSEDKVLSLEVETINRPPLPSEEVGVGYIDVASHKFVELGRTNAFNYPQGARQQWIDDTHFIVNNQVGDHWGADIYGVLDGVKVKSIDKTCHCLSLDKKYAFGLNYSRLHRLGGYGYIGLEDPTKNEETPESDGIWKTCIENNESKLLVSINEVANCQPETSAHNGFHHYVTHLVLSPEGNRIAFLHRFFLADGGIRTRLMTVGADGEDLRCLACGFLSHFDWKDNKHIFIWGRTGSSVDAMRSNPIFSNPLVKPFLNSIKFLVRKLLKRSKGMSMSFLEIEDATQPTINPMAQGVMTCDGHPMTCPSDRDMCICDTYPNKDKERDLFTYRFSTGERVNLGKFRMSDEQPDSALFEQYSKGVDSDIMKLFNPKLFTFSRSGLHCDLHPRWSADGRNVYFDSIHEGQRQIYCVQVLS